MLIKVLKIHTFSCFSFNFSFMTVFQFLFSSIFTFFSFVLVLRQVANWCLCIKDLWVDISTILSKYQYLYKYDTFNIPVLINQCDTFNKPVLINQFVTFNVPVFIHKYETFNMPVFINKYDTFNMPAFINQLLCFIVELSQCLMAWLVSS